MTCASAVSAKTAIFASFALLVAIFACTWRPASCFGQRRTGGGRAEDGGGSIPIDVLNSVWNYRHKETGPESWDKLFKSCGGKFQSPIDVDTAAATNWGSARFQFSAGFSARPDSMTLENNGNTVILVAGGIQAVTLKGGDLPGEFNLVHAHFHWGSNSTRGSEHLLDGKAYPMEMHLVHYNARFPNVSAALGTKDHDALAVLGFMFEVTEYDNDRLEKLVTRLKELAKVSRDDRNVQKITFPATDAFPIFNLVDIDFSDDEGDDEKEEYGSANVGATANRTTAEFNRVYDEFYRYEGSLTTPTCDEQVQWTVFRKPVPISERQLDAFRALRDKHGWPLSDNFRPVEPLGKRVVRRYSTSSSLSSMAAAGAAGSGSSSASDPTLSPREANDVAHNHQKDHDTYYEPSYYSRPDIVSILKAGIADNQVQELPSDADEGGRRQNSGRPCSDENRNCDSGRRKLEEDRPPPAPPSWTSVLEDPGSRVDEEKDEYGRQLLPTAATHPSGLAAASNNGTWGSRPPSMTAEDADESDDEDERLDGEADSESSARSASAGGGFSNNTKVWMFVAAATAIVFGVSMLAGNH